MNVQSLAMHFQTYFEIGLAQTPSMLEQAYRLRFDVYCREFHYEKEVDCPGGLERDEYDRYSRHFMVFHRASGASAGCVRMIEPVAEDPDFRLPMEKHCGDTLNHPVYDPRRMPRTGIAEISRLAVHTTFRRRRGESESPMGALLHEGSPSEQERRTFPLISLALFAGAVAMMTLNRREHLFVMMEPRLARRLHGVGFPFAPVGDVVDYHGLRAAYHVTVDDIVNGIRGEMREIYRFIDETLKNPARLGGLPGTH